MMTLITALASSNWVAMAADRRLTSNDSHGQVIWQRDATTKISVVDGEYLVGFAGQLIQGDLERGFEEWLVHAVSTLKKGNLAPHLVSKLNEYWASQPHLAGRAMVVVLAGFALTSKPPYIRTEILRISNGRLGKDNSIQLHSHGSNKFGVFPVRPPTGFAMDTEGVSVDQREFEPYVNPLKGCPILNVGAANLVRRSLISFHQSVAEQANGTVGTGTTVVTFPRTAYRSASVVGDLRGQADPANDIVGFYVDPATDASDVYVPGLIPSGRKNASVVTVTDVRINTAADGLLGPAERIRPER